MLRTSLFQEHLNLNALMVEFAGWEMPVQYSSIIDESKSVRQNAGMFDVSHMGRVWFKGERVFDFLQYLTVNDVDKLADGGSQYSMMLYPDGGVVDDIIVYRIKADEYMIVWNASNRDKDLKWAQEHLTPFGDIKITDTTFETGMIAVQGPNAVKIIDELAETPVSDSERFTLTEVTLCGESVLACRTGYTGEDGFELIMSADASVKIWQALLAKGVTPCGLASRDVLRVEAGYPLYGHEINAEINPISAGLGWVISKTKEFNGSDAIQSARENGTEKKCVGVLMETKIVPREGYEIFIDERKIGAVSSGVYSPLIEKGIAFAFVNAEDSKMETAVSVMIRDRKHPAQIVNKRFVKSK